MEYFCAFKCSYDADACWRSGDFDKKQAISKREAMSKKTRDEILHDHNNDGVDRRGFWKCMAWAGTGAFCVIKGGVLNSHSSSRLSEIGEPEMAGDLSFAQIRDSHMGFNKPANPDVAGTLQAAVKGPDGVKRTPPVQKSRKVMKLFCGAIILACAPLAFAGNDAAHPIEKVAAFVIQKLDVTTLPSAIRPKREKNKKTFADYGYVMRKVDEKEALLEAPQTGAEITISILEEKKSGIYVCVNGQTQTEGSSHFQRVFLLSQKNTSALLKGRESSKEFDGCPVIGGGDNDSQPNGY